MGRGQGPRAPLPPPGRRPALTRGRPTPTRPGTRVGPGLRSRHDGTTRGDRWRRGGDERRPRRCGGRSPTPRSSSSRRAAAPATRRAASRTSWPARSTTSSRSSPAAPRSSGPQGIDVRIAHRGARPSTSTPARSRPATSTAAPPSTLGFDQLMIGTGARPTVPAWPGVDLPHVLGRPHACPTRRRLDELAADCGGGRRRRRRRRLHRHRDGRGVPRPRAPRSRSLDIAPHGAAQPRPGDVRAGRRRRARRQGIERRTSACTWRPSPSRTGRRAPRWSCPPTSSCSPSGVTPNSELARGGRAGDRRAQRASSVDDHQRTSRRGRLGRRRLRRVVPPGHRRRRPGSRSAPWPTRQARVAGINLGGRRRHLPRGARHRHHPAVRHRDRPHRAHRGRGRRGRLRPGRHQHRGDDPGRLLPGRRRR